MSAAVHRRAVLAGVAASLAAPAVPGRAQDGGDPGAGVIGGPLLSLRSGSGPAPGAAQGAAERAGFEAAARYSADRRGVSLLVMRAGEILFEDYPDQGGAGRAWELASGTKSFSGIAAAAAAADGLLDIDERAADTLQEWRGDPQRARITIRHLLTLTSGVQSEHIGRAPTYAAALRSEVAGAPGERFAYGPAPFQIFGEIMRRKLAGRRGPQDAAAYVQARVLAPHGIAVALWRTHRRDGYPLMPQGAQLTARDWARFGQYVLDGGEGLDRATFRACFEPTRANPGYGLTWWLLRPGLVPPGRAAGLEVLDAAALEREDIVMAAGAGNQRLYLLRRRGLVVARQAAGILRAARTDWRDAEFLRALAG